MTRRQLPARCNRGKNTFYVSQIQSLKDEKTRDTLIKGKKRGQTTLGDQIDKRLKQSIQNKRQIYNENKKNFKFTRGIHYFYDLNKLQRVSQSVSYVIFSSKKQKKISKNKNYSINYSSDNQLIGTSKISELINRNYIGLPKHQQFASNNKNIQSQYFYNQKTINQIIQLKRNDKNQCHHYLFEVEDKKHNLDRMIKQFQFIYKKREYYFKPENLTKLKSFSVIEKDSQLTQIIFQSSSDDEQPLTMQQKIEYLQQKIQNLYEKREKLNITYEQVSSMYYHNSLDQKIFNEIKRQKQSLDRFSIYQSMQKNIKLHSQEQNKSKIPSENNNLNTSTILKNYRNFHRQEQSDAQNSQLSDYYCIDNKTFDSYIMQKALKIISIRLCHEGDNCYYLGKKVFLTLFNKDLMLEKQIKASSLEQYTTKLKEIEESLIKYHKKQSNSNNKNSGQNSIRQTEKFINGQKHPKSQIPKNQINLQVNQRVTPIDFYQYYCLKIFESIYDSLYVIKQFIEKNQNKKINLIQTLASLYYPKLESRLLTIVRVPKFGMLTIALDKLVEVVTHKKQFQQMNYHLFVQYNQKLKNITTFVKEMESQSSSYNSSIEQNEQSIILGKRFNYKENEEEQEKIGQYGSNPKPRKMVKCGDLE